MATERVPYTLANVRRGWPLFGLLLAAGCAQPASRVTIDFARDSVGHAPAGFSQGLTGGGGPVAWTVRDGVDGRVLLQESADDTSYRFPLCIYDRFAARDVAAEVRFKAIAGTVDQAAGLVLRYRPENYYIARANALENNVNLFKTVNGKREKIAEVDVGVATNQWHTLRFEARGPHLSVALDGRAVVSADDPTFAGAGKVGLWTKADSVTAFAGLKIDPLP